MPQACATVSNEVYVTHVAIDIEVSSASALTLPYAFKAAGSALVNGLIRASLSVPSGVSFENFNLSFSQEGSISATGGQVALRSSSVNVFRAPIIQASATTASVSFINTTFSIAPSTAVTQPIIYSASSSFEAQQVVVSGVFGSAPIDSFLVTQSSSVSIKDSAFANFTAKNVIRSSGGEHFNLTDSTFKSLGDAKNPLVAAVSVESATHLSLDSVTISSIDANHGLYLEDVETVSVVDTVFANITTSLSCAAMRLNGVSESAELQDLTFEYNSFGEWWTVCVKASETLAAGTSASLDARRLTFNGNFNPKDVPLYEMTGWSFLIEGNIVATLQDLDFEGENKYFSSVGVVGANATVLPNNQMSGNIAWRGFVGLCGAISFEGDADMSGRVLLSRADGLPCTQLNTIDLKGNTLQLIDPFENAPEERELMADHWLQTAHFMNGVLKINTPKTTVCCDVVLDNYEFSDSVNLTNLYLYANTTLTWGASKTGFYLLDSNSRLIIEEAGTILQTRPQSATDPRTLISGEGVVEVMPGGRVFSASLDFDVALFELNSESTLYLYPSNWSGIVQHTKIKNSAWGGEIRFMTDYLVGEFTPNLVFDLETRSYTPTGDFQVLETPNHQDVLTTGAVDFDFVSDDGPATPTMITPIVTLSPSQSSLVIDFPISVRPSDAVPCPELAFELMGLQFFNYTCIWRNSTQVELFLPYIKPTVPFRLLPTDIFREASVQFDYSILEPLIADISYKIDQCGIITLSSQHSRLGSVIVDFIGWNVFCASVASGPCSTSGGLPVTPTFTIDTNAIPTVDGVYYVSLHIETSTGSASTSISIEMPNSLLQVSIDGPSNRTVIASSGLSLFARLNLPANCPSTPRVTYMWTIGDLSTPSIVTNKPFLHIPSNALPSNLDFSKKYEIEVSVHNTESPSVILTSASTNVTFVKFLPLLVSSNPRYVYGSQASVIDLSVETQPLVDDPSNTRYLWSILECPELNPGSRFRPVVGLNLTIPEEFKCKFANGTTFDGPYITTSPRLNFPAAGLLQGIYRLQVTRTSLIGGRITPQSTDTSTQVSFLKNSASTTMWAEIVVASVQSLRAAQRLPARLQIKNGLQTLIGTNITKHYSIEWSVLAPRPIPLSQETLSKPFLIVPFEAILTGEVTLQAILTPKTRSFPSLIASRSIDLGTGPTGGYIQVTSLGNFLVTISTFGWSSHIGSGSGSEILRYQFFAFNGDTGVTAALSDIMDSSTLTVQLTSDTEYVFSVIAYDAAGRSSSVLSYSYVTGQINRDAKSESLNRDVSTSVETALNASDWRMLQTIVAQQIATDNSAPIPRGQLLNASLLLAPALPPTESSASTTLATIETLLEFADQNEESLISQLDTLTQSAILEFIQEQLDSAGSRFGSASSSSLSSSKSLMNILSSLLTKVPSSLLNATQNPNQDTVLSLLSGHALQVLTQLFPEETVEIPTGNSVSLVVGKIGALLNDTLQLSPRPSNPFPGVPIATPLGTPPTNSPLTSSPLSSSPHSGAPGTGGPGTNNPVSSSPSGPSTPAASTPDGNAPSSVVQTPVIVTVSSVPVEGYIGFTHTVFENGTYPVPSAISTVSVLSFSNSGVNVTDLDPTKNYESTLTLPGKQTLPTTTTTFTISAIAPSGTKPKCGTYDASSGKWIAASGCTTKVMNGQVSCTCKNGGPPTLSVIFQVDGGIGGSSKNGGLSTLGIVMLSVFMSILFLLIVVVLIFTLAPCARKIVRPYSKRAHGFS